MSQATPLITVNPYEMVIGSDAYRAKWDEDDRVRCTCVHRDWWHAGAVRRITTQCLNSTRHPSGHCGDCRTVEDLKKETPE